MADFLIEDDLASFLRVAPSRVTGCQFLLDLAVGLVTEKIGVQATLSTTAKTVALAAAARAYFNPEGLRSETVGGWTGTRDAGELGVYLTDDEVKRLTAATSDAGLPRYEFPVPDYTWLATDATVVSG